MKQPPFFVGMSCMGHESITNVVVCAMAHCPAVTAPLPAGHEGRLRRHCFSEFCCQKKKKKKLFLYKMWQKAMESELQMLFSVGTRRPLVASPQQVIPPKTNEWTNQTNTTDTQSTSCVETRKTRGDPAPFFCFFSLLFTCSPFTFCNLTGHRCFGAAGAGAGHTRYT